jgi:alpha-L-rhamnosidase
MLFRHRSQAPAIFLPWLGLAAFNLAIAVAVTMAKAGETIQAQPAVEIMTTTDPRCEYRDDPLGIDVIAPRLSWIVSSTRRGQKQTAYHVLVASDLPTLGRDEGDLWDSGRIASDETTAIVYAGKPLHSHQACFWKVRVWDKEGAPSAWSKTARWSMGLLD